MCYTDSMNLIPGKTYRLEMVCPSRPYSAMVDVEVLQVHDDGTVTIKTGNRGRLKGGYTNRVALEGPGFRRVLTEWVSDGS